MKTIKTLAIAAIAFAAMSFTVAAVNPIEKAALSMSELALDTAVEQGYISVNDKQTVLESGIIEEMAQTLVDTNYDLSATVDRGADIAVEKGWFENKAAAKSALRKAINEARQNQGAINKLYSLLGI